MTNKAKKGEAPVRNVVLRDNTLNIYIDGSSKSKPRRGGMGIVFVTTDDAGEPVVKDVSPMGYKGADSALMELCACVESLKKALVLSDLYTYHSILIVSDSQYVVNGFRSAKFIWPKTKWKDRYGRPIAHAKKWKELTRTLRKIRMPVDIEWVKGHDSNIYNKIVDTLAKQSAEGMLRDKMQASTVRRKLTKNKAKRGCVEMRGQTMDIHIYVDTYDSVSDLYKYTYEVLNEESAFYQLADYLFYDQVLRAGHFYRVRVNNSTPSPRIVEVVCELDKETCQPMVE